MSKYEELSKAELYRKERKERLAKEAKKNAKRNAKVAKMKRIAIRAVAVVAAVAIVLGATVAIVNYTGSLFFKPAIAKVGDTKISSSEFQYYYRTTYANLVSNAMQTDQQYGSGYYAQYQGFDYTKLPTEQNFPNDMLPEGEKTTYATWDDYLTEETISAIQYLYAVEAEAEKAGVKLTDEETEAINAQIEEMRKSATEGGATLNAYLTMTYGSGINEKNVKTWMLRDALAQKYAEMKNEELYDAITPDAIEAEYKENKADYQYADFRLYVFDVDTSDVKEGTSESEANKIQKDAEAKAKKEAEAFIKNIKTEADFVKAADKLDKAKEKEDESATPSTTTAEETTKFEKAQYATLEQAFGEENAKWAMDEARKTGEKKVLPYKENGKVVGYYAIFVVKAAYRDDAIANNVKAYSFAYSASSTVTSKVDDATKKATKEKAQVLLDHWSGHDSKNGTAESFASLAAHVYPEEASTLVCSDYANYTTGTLPEEVEKWIADKARKHNDTALIETETGCYVVYFDSRNTEANWQLAVKDVLAQASYTEYEDSLVNNAEYALDRSGALMSAFLKMKKAKINKDVKQYLYAMMQSMQSSNTMSY